MKRISSTWLLGLALLLAMSASARQTPCTAKLLVSGYFSTVHVYDACSGQHLRNLDDSGRIRGPQAIRLGPDGALYVVSEESGQILRYRADTFEFLGEFIRLPDAVKPTGLAFGPKGEAMVAGYGTDDVRRYDKDGTRPTIAVAARAAGVDGPDNGFMLGPDGRYYLPGYDSNSVVRLDPATGLTTTVITANREGLRGTRGILADRNGQELWITGETSGQLLKYNIASGSLQVVRSGMSRPTGIDYGPSGDLLIATSGPVERINPATGATTGTLVAAGAGGLSGPTFILVLDNAKAKPPVDAAQVGTQFWISGIATLAGNVLDVQSADSANGALFGDVFSPAAVRRKRWGSMRIEFTSCTTARLGWNSSSNDSAGFGTGGYDLVRLLDTEAAQRCQQQGFQASDKTWISGAWYGGEARSGEGILIDYRASDRLAFLAWFTFRPTP